MLGRSWRVRRVKRRGYHVPINALMQRGTSANSSAVEANNLFHLQMQCNLSLLELIAYSRLVPAEMANISKSCFLVSTVVVHFTLSHLLSFVEVMFTAMVLHLLLLNLHQSGLI